MFSLLFIKNNSIPKILINSLNSSRKFSQNHVVYKSSLLLRTLLEKSRGNNIETHLRTSHLIKRHNGTTAYWEEKINVANNVILYKYEKGRFFTFGHIFGISNIILWILGCWYFYKDMFFEIWSELSRESLQKNFFSLTAFLFSTTLGPVFYVLLCFLGARSVKYIILNKGGTHVTFVTFHPLKSKRIIHVPLDKVYCIQPRNFGRGAYTSVKISPYKFNFLLDKNGIYVNGDLFDHTVAWRK